MRGNHQRGIVYITKEQQMKRSKRVPKRQTGIHPSDVTTSQAVVLPADVPTPIDPYVVYRTTAERERAYETLLARRKEREEFVEANFGHPLADENGCVPVSGSSDTPIKLPPIKLSSIVPSTPASDHPYTPDPSRNKDIEYLLSLGCIFDCRPPITTPTEESDEQFLESLEALLAAQARGNMIPASYNPVIDIKKNKYEYGRMEDCAKKAIHEYNKIEATNYKYSRIVKAGWQAVNGTNYFIIFQATMSEDSNEFDTFEAFAHCRVTVPPKLVSCNRVKAVGKSGCEMHEIPCDV